MSDTQRKFKNATRISSDNYNIILVFKRVKNFQNSNLMLDLTEHFGITNFEWESRDEITIRKPVTRAEPIAIVEQNGIDFSMESKKENLDDLMDLLLSQQSLYYGSGKDGDIPLVSLGTNKRTNISSDSSIKNGVSIFNDSSVRFGTTPIYDLIIKIRHYDLDKDGNNRFEQITLKDVVFYKPYQKVSENSSSISEGFKGFASRIITSNGTKENSTFKQLVEKSLIAEYDNTGEVEDFPRVVINPDNKDLIE